MRWTTAAVLAAVLTAIFGRPFAQYETQKLLPIGTLTVERTPQGVHIVGEVGEGTGEDWATAVENLRENAAGDVFFGTAEEIVCADRELVRQAVLSGDLRPAARVIFAREDGMTVAELRALYAGEAVR